MDEEQEKRGGEEVRSPLQVVIRVVLALLMIAVLVGLILAVVLRPERVVEPPDGAAVQPSHDLIAGAARFSDSKNLACACPQPPQFSQLYL